MSEIEVGEYVRTNRGSIGQCIGIFNGHVKAKYHIQFQGGVKVKRQWLSTNTITKHSKNIIDLIEVGDFVNGFEIDKFDDTEGNIYLGIPIYDDALMDCISEFLPIDKIEIKEILTHEQYENNSYKVVK